MREAIGDIWCQQPQAIVAIPTGGGVNRRGEALLLRGLGRQARERWPELPAALGALLRQQGNRVHELPHSLVSFPVEDDPFEVARPDRIDRSCRQLVLLADQRGWLQVALPRVGCGGGLLDWAAVRPILLRHLDDRFLVVSPV